MLTNPLQQFANWTGSLSPIPRTLVWVWLVLVVAIVLGGSLAVFDQLLSFGVRRFRPAKDHPPAAPGLRSERKRLDNLVRLGDRRD